MHTPLGSVLCFLVAALVGAVGQYLYKVGADRAGGTFQSYLLNPPLILGVACYVAVMALFVAGFKRGGALSVLYPLYASTFVWGAVIAWLAYREPIRPVNVGGMVLLLAGMYLMGVGK
jgi:multidrug transporter EmrE-like cation transporter